MGKDDLRKMRPEQASSDRDGNITDTLPTASRRRLLQRTDPEVYFRFPEPACILTLSITRTSTAGRLEPPSRPLKVQPCFAFGADMIPFFGSHWEGKPSAFTTMAHTTRGRLDSGYDTQPVACATRRKCLAQRKSSVCCVGAV